MFTQNDLRQFQAKGIDLKVIEQQIDNFKTGFPFVELVAPATISNGMKSFAEAEADKLIHFYDKNYEDFEILKFVPASGAASRMFKTLFEFREKITGTDSIDELLNNDKGFNSVFNFISQLHNFAFFNDLRQVMSASGLNIESCMAEKDYKSIIDFLLEDKGLGYAALPKALLKFHNYDDGARMAMEEHLVEGANYGQNNDGRVAIHFTVSPEHADRFIEEINRIKDKYELLFDVIYELTFSIQKSSTDTIAVDSRNKPFRNDDESIVFRPGGHGALIENLNDREGEIIFIKNIDNIVPDRLKDQTYRYKRVIGGYLIELRNKVFDCLEKLEEGNVSENDLKKMLIFAREKLHIVTPHDFDEMSTIEKIDYLYTKLNRPIRICGMVKNEGEPGGGPFWTKNTEEEISLQIVESSQIDLDNPGQKEIFSKATHFNPVDLVCYVRNFNGEQFDLREFVDPSTGFISVKSKDGLELKAQELPGLWNGAMADWITVFVEVPIITFNPVKTVNDLLRKEHQPG